MLIKIFMLDNVNNIITHQKRILINYLQRDVIYVCISLVQIYVYK